MSEPIQTFSISDLLRHSIPSIGAASLPSPPPPKRPKSLNPNPVPDPNPRSFSSITHSAILTGTIDFHSSDAPIACKSHCFSFSDGSSSVCASILDLDPNAVGRSIEVTAWNYLPFNSGLLEIIKWRFSSLLPLRCSPRSEIVGRLISVSPIFNVPSRNPNSAGDSLGFLAEIATCGCDLCKNYNGVKSPTWEQSHHSFGEPKFVYFLNPSSKWQPVVNKLVGMLIGVSGMRERSIFVRGDTSYRMLVTTERSAVSLCRLLLDANSVGKRVNCKEGIYCGVVTGVYMNGMAVELDGKVWLLITDTSIAPEHSLRVGAIISVRNFHRVHPKFSWIKMLLLGSCVRTSIDIKSFSLSNSRSYVWTKSQSTLGNFIGSLTLSSKFWVLLLVSCFQKKFAKIFSDKQILGSKNQEGFAQVYASASLASHNFKLQQNGVFMDFCKHGNCICRNEPDLTPLRLVIPFSNLITKCEATWVSLLSKTEYDAETVNRGDYDYCSTYEGATFSNIIRRIMPSKDLGFILIGSLKISSSSGRLQLTDETGSIDAVVPDLLSDTNVHCIYEVQNYKLVMEGPAIHLDSDEFHFSEALSCRSIFEKFPLKNVLNQFAVYVHFYLKDSTCLNASFGLPSYTDRNDAIGTVTGETNHMLLVTHKFPATENLQADPNMSCNSCLYAEAILLPYKLTLSKDNNYNQNEEVIHDKQHSHSNYFGNPESQKNGRPKKPKVFGICSRIKVNISETNPGECNGLIPKIPCVFTFKSATNEGTLIPGYLFHTEETSLGNQWEKRILLEFMSDSFCKYQLLQLGGYYIVKCSERGHPFRIAKGIDKASCSKICITSDAALCSLSFSFDEIMRQKESQSQSSEVPSNEVSGVYPGQMCQKDLIFTDSLRHAHCHSDIHVHLPSELVLSLTTATKAKDKDGLMRLLPTFGEVLNVSSCIKVMKAEVPRPFGTTDSENCYLPQGRLISLCGDIGNIQVYNCQPRSDMNSQHSEFTNVNQRTLCKIVINVYDDHHMVQICGNWNKYAYPLGMGPGANATFYRVLMTITPSGCPRLLLTPVSFAVINSIKTADHQLSQGGSTPLPRLDILNLDPLHSIPLGLISQLAQQMESKPVLMHCRVVMILHLALEKHSYGPSKSDSLRQFESSNFAIPLAGFVLDDGSSLCCCWANAVRAEMLLKLHETMQKPFYNGDRNLRTAAGKSNGATVGYHMEKMLKKYNRVTMKNHRVAPDPSSLGFTFTVDSDEIFSYSDERLLRIIMVNACAGSTFNVIGKMMDPNDFHKLDILLEGLDITMQPMRHFWITEVGYINPLKEGRNILDELASVVDHQGLHIFVRVKHLKCSRKGTSRLLDSFCKFSLQPCPMTALQISQLSDLMQEDGLLRMFKGLNKQSYRGKHKILDADYSLLLSVFNGSSIQHFDEANF